VEKINKDKTVESLFNIPVVALTGENVGIARKHQRTLETNRIRRNSLNNEQKKLEKRKKTLWTVKK
jgi:hypothetical protein